MFFLINGGNWVWWTDPPSQGNQDDILDKNNKSSSQICDYSEQRKSLILMSPIECSFTKYHSKNDVINQKPFRTRCVYNVSSELFAWGIHPPWKQIRFETIWTPRLSSGWPGRRLKGKVADSNVRGSQRGQRKALMINALKRWANSDTNRGSTCTV